jgi:hypothetical protein
MFWRRAQVGVQETLGSGGELEATENSGVRRPGPVVAVPYCLCVITLIACSILPPRLAPTVWLGPPSSTAEVPGQLEAEIDGKFTGGELPCNDGGVSGKWYLDGVYAGRPQWTDLNGHHLRWQAKAVVNASAWAFGLDDPASVPGVEAYGEAYAFLPRTTTSACSSTVRVEPRYPEPGGEALAARQIQWNIAQWNPQSACAGQLCPSVCSGSGTSTQECCLPPGDYILNCFTSSATGGWGPGEYLRMGGRDRCTRFENGESTLKFRVGPGGIPAHADAGSMLPSLSSVWHCHNRAAHAGDTYDGNDDVVHTDHDATFDDIERHVELTPSNMLPLGSTFRPPPWYSFGLTAAQWVSYVRLLCTCVLLTHCIFAFRISRLTPAARGEPDSSDETSDEDNLRAWVIQSLLFGYLGYRLHRFHLGSLQSRVTALMRSPEWLISDETEYIGALRRLRMIKSIGAPPMTVLPLETLVKVGRIPRSDEGYTVDAEQLMKKAGRKGITPDDPKDESMLDEQGQDRLNLTGQPIRARSLRFGLHIVFVSHRWLSVDHPDDAACTKARALIEFGQWLGGGLGIGQIAFWIDFSSVDQTKDIEQGTTALPLYLSTARNIVCYETEDYDQRSWCRLERVMAYAFSFNGKQPFTIKRGFANARQKPRIEVRLLADPLSADSCLTVAADQSIISALSSFSTQSTAFTFHSWTLKELAGLYLSRRPLPIIGGSLMIAFMVLFWPWVILNLVQITSVAGMALLGGSFWIGLATFYYRTASPFVRPSPRLGASEVEVRTLSPKLNPQAAMQRLFSKYADGEANARISQDAYAQFLTDVQYGHGHDKTVEGRKIGRITMLYVAFCFVLFTVALSPIVWESMMEFWMVWVMPWWVIAGMIIPMMYIKYPKDVCPFGSAYFNKNRCDSKLWMAHCRHLHPVKTSIFAKSELTILMKAGLDLKQFKRWYVRFNRSLIEDYSLCFQLDKHVVSELFTREISEEDCCAICFDPLDMDGVASRTPQKLPTCGHSFHKGCLALMSKTTQEIKSNCPVCRQPFEMQLATLESLTPDPSMRASSVSNPVHSMLVTERQAPPPAVAAASAVAHADTATSSEDGESSSEESGSSSSSSSTEEEEEEEEEEEDLEQELRTQLGQLRLGGLQQRATKLGVDAMQLAHALDQDAPKKAMINLIVQTVLSPGSAPTV